MNPTVEQWLQTQKEARSASKRTQREKHLIELGLFDENTVRYVDGRGNTLTKEEYDNLIKAGYTAHEKKGALDVTDEEYAEICKYAPEKKIADDITNRGAEKGIVKFANVVKIIGVILWVILALAGLIDGAYSISFIVSFFVGVFSGFICWLGCYLTWAVLTVFTNISNTLYRIEAKTGMA